jgi:hypothetical protein
MRHANYVMTLKGYDIIGYWEPCKARTLTGAKREASRRHGTGFSHHRIVIAIDHGDGLYQPIAERWVSRKQWEEKP